MIANTAETLSRGMTVFTEQLGIVGAEAFIFYIKTEGFDYTKWQSDYFGNMTKKEIDEDMDVYFAKHPYDGDFKKII